MKKSLSLFLLLGISCIHSSQATSLEDLNKERAAIEAEFAENSEALKRMNEEKKVLIDKLVELNSQADDVSKSLDAKFDLRPIPIGISEIARYFGRKNINRCKVSLGDQPGEYFIQKDKIKIRFAFLDRNNVRPAKLGLIRGRENREVFQIEQTAYDPNATNLDGGMHALLKFNIKADNTPGDIIHAVITGQRINDKWFGQGSSLDITPITCATDL